MKANSKKARHPAATAAGLCVVYGALLSSVLIFFSACTGNRDDGNGSDTVDGSYVSTEKQTEANGTTAGTTGGTTGGITDGTTGGTTGGSTDGTTGDTNGAADGTVGSDNITK